MVYIQDRNLPDMWLPPRSTLWFAPISNVWVMCTSLGRSNSSLSSTQQLRELSKSWTCRSSLKNSPTNLPPHCLAKASSPCMTSPYFTPPAPSAALLSRTGLPPVPPHSMQFHMAVLLLIWSLSLWKPFFHSPLSPITWLGPIHSLRLGSSAPSLQPQASCVRDRSSALP